MSINSKSLLRHPHLLGYYDHKNEPQVYPTAGEIHSLIDITMHEMAHKWLAERSTIGIFMQLLVRQYESIASTGEEGFNELSLLGEIINNITELLENVYEGFATYVEFFINRHKHTQEEFMKTLEQTREPVYLMGFNTAKQIESIIHPKELRSYTETELNKICLSTLIDISRFALNIPIPDDFDINKFLTIMREYSPADRWSTVLNSLANDVDLRKSFLNKSDSTFGSWLRKRHNRFSIDGKYSGILYADNIEEIIATLFPNLSYNSPENSSLSKIITFRGSREKEPTPDYLLREHCAELRFSPLERLEHVPDMKENELAKRFSDLKSHGAGCYVRFITAPNNNNLEIQVGPNSEDILMLLSGSVAVFIHEAYFSYNQDSKRIWHYAGYGYSCIIDKSSIKKILLSLSWLDALVVFECNLELFDNPYSPEGFSNFKSPLFLVPSKIGSLDSIVRPFSFDRWSSESRFLVVNNWNHFEGAGTDQIWLVWLISEDGKISILNFASEDALIGLDFWDKYVGIPDTIRRYNDYDITGISVSIESDRWFLDSERSEFVAPKNSDVVTSHQMSFGW